MAQLTVKEFDDLIGKLVAHLGLNQFYEKLLKAMPRCRVSARANVQALAMQLYQLSAGLRREHPARYAVEVLWQDMLSKSVNEEQSKSIEGLIEKVNAGSPNGSRLSRRKRTILSRLLEIITEVWRLTQMMKLHTRKCYSGRRATWRAFFVNDELR